MILKLGVFETHWGPDQNNLQDEGMVGYNGDDTMRIQNHSYMIFGCF